MVFVCRGEFVRDMVHVDGGVLWCRILVHVE